MKQQPKSISSVSEACDYFLEVFRQHPERDAAGAYEAAIGGQRRPYPVLSLNHLGVPGDVDTPPGEIELPAVRMPDGPEADLARDVIAMLEPLKLLNPIASAFGLGKGPGTLVTSFGIPINPEAQNTAAFSRPLDEVLAEPPPDPATAGLMPAMHERIDRIRALTPPEFKIHLPDVQGPFDLAHAVVGNDVFTAPADDPAKFRALMERTTTLWIEAVRLLRRWIGPERLAAGEGTRIPRISECSVNLVSADFYRQFILPHDRRLAEAFEMLHIHPCSGPHVFRVTFENLPVAIIEAGFIERTAAGAIAVDDALKIIGDRPILLLIGQELPVGQEYEFIRRDLDRCATNPRLLFNYTGMHWRRQDRPLIREIHRRLDEHWARTLRP